MKSAWWMNDSDYTEEALLPQELDSYANGPFGPAFVQAWPNGSTTKGWGEANFMENYRKGKFLFAPYKAKFEQKPFPVAYVMRSFQLICIDIDGKNSGFEHAGQLGMLPYTLAETSKSGNGYHLFYSTPNDSWDPDKGFAGFADHIGIVPGVDIRATGCVYHYPNQMWNTRNVAPLPAHLERLLNHRKSLVSANAGEYQAIQQGTEEEKLMAQYQLVEDLAQPIPVGKRNITLFALGSKMYLSDVPNWEDLISKRADELCMDFEEAKKIVRNIKQYAVKETP